MKARFLALAALVLGLASCQNDPEVDGFVTVGGEVDFQLAVSADELATRAGDSNQNQAGRDSAFGAIDYLQGSATGDACVDWAEVDLRYTLEVYDYDANKVYGDEFKPIKDRQVIVVDEYESVVFDLRLVPNRKYHFVVFADFIAANPAIDVNNPAIEVQRELGLRHNIGTTLKDITIKADALNDEVADAYFATKDIEISNSATQDIELKRPYGKVRVIATDLAELNLNVEPGKVEVAYDAFHPNKFNALTGKASGEYSTRVYAFEYADGVLKSDLSEHVYTAGYDNRDPYSYENANGEVRHTHMTLFTDYILTADEAQKPYQFSMRVSDKNGTPIKTTHFNTDIPVQRNHLTTIIGNVLTTATEIEVTIDDNFANKTVKGVQFVSTAKELQEAVDYYTATVLNELDADDVTIFFENDINGDVTVTQKEGVNMIICGNGHKFDGKFTINGAARSNGAETLTFDNIEFETAWDNEDKANDWSFITAPSKINGVYNYAHNVTIKNCTFTNTVDGNWHVGAASFTGAYNISMVECAAYNMHSIAQFQSIDNKVLVQDVVVANSKSGVSFGNTAYPTLKDAVIEAAEYGVRADANADRGNLVMEDVAIDAKFPIIVRKTTTAGYTVNLGDDVVLEAPGYHIVFTKGADDAEVFEAPEVEFIVNGADDYYVFPGNKIFAYNQASLQYFLDNTKNGDNKIELAANIEGDVVVDQQEGKNVLINGHKYNYYGTISIDGNARMDGAETVRIYAVNFVAPANETIDFIEQNSTDGAVRYAHNVTIERCVFEGGENAVAARFRQCKNITFNTCKVKAGHSLAQLTGCNGVAINGTTVNALRGVSFGTSTNCSVANSTFNVEKYGLRADGSVVTALNIDNTTVNAAKPVIVRKVSGKYDVNFTGTNVLGTTGYQVVFTTGADDAAFVAPADDKYAVTGADAFTVFPRDAATSGIVYNAEELAVALNNPLVSEIYLQEGEYGTIVAKSNKTIYGSEKAKVDCVDLNGAENLTLKCINFDAATAKMSYDGVGTAKVYANIISGSTSKPIVGAHNLTIEECTFTGTFTNGGAAIAFVDQKRSSGGSGNVTIKSCTFETEGGWYDIYGHYTGNGLNGYDKFVIEGNTFNTEFTQGLPVYLGRYASSTPVVVKDNAFNTVNSLDNAVYVQDHSNYGVSIDASGNTFAN